MTPQIPIGPARRQSGAIIFVALVMLLVIALVAVAGMRVTTLESRVTANALEQQRLRSAAESALRAGEWAVLNGATDLSACSEDSTSLCYARDCSTANCTPDDTDFLTASSYAYAGADGGTSLVDPRNTGIELNARWNLAYVGRPPGSTGTSALKAATSGTTIYVEVDAWAYRGDDAPTTCGAQALCLRSTVSLLVK